MPRARAVSEPPTEPGKGRYYMISVVAKAYGISNAKGYEPAESELPLETVWNTPRYLEVVPKLFEQLRKDLTRAGDRPRVE